MKAVIVLLVLGLLAATSPVQAQTGGIQVAPVFVSLRPERAISSVHISNGRDEAVAFELDAYVWTQENGESALPPTRELLVAPGVFEIPAGGQQIVRLGAHSTGDDERAYRIVMRELPRLYEHGAMLGFALEMSMPVFMTPEGAQARIDAHVTGEGVVLSNSGDAHAQIALFDGLERIAAPRYLLAGASAQIQAPARALSLRVASIHGEQSERTIHAGGQDLSASLH